MTTEDIVGLYDCFARIVAMEPDLILVSREEYTASFARQNLRDQYRVAVQNDQIVGYVGWQIWEEARQKGYAGLRGPGVDPHYQNRGLGQELARKVIRLARIQGVPRLRAVLTPRQVKGIHLAEKSGMYIHHYNFRMRMCPLRPQRHSFPAGYYMRPMQEAEKGILLEMIQEIFGHNPELCSDIELWLVSPSLSKEVFFLISPTDEEVGFVWLQGGHLDRDTGLPMAVGILGGIRKPYRSLEIALAGLDWMVDHSAGMGTKILEFGIESENDRVKRLFEWYGFSEAARRICYEGIVSEMLSSDLFRAPKEVTVGNLS